MAKRADLIDNDTWSRLLESSGCSPHLAGEIFRYLIVTITELSASSERATAMVADLREGARMAFRRSDVGLAAEALAILSAKGMTAVDNEPLKLLVAALRRQYDGVPYANERRPIIDLLTYIKESGGSHDGEDSGEEDSDEDNNRSRRPDRAAALIEALMEAG